MLFLNLPVAPVNDVHLAAFQLGERIGKCIMDMDSGYFKKEVILQKKILRI